jgi:hypothetical protein
MAAIVRVSLALAVSILSVIGPGCASLLTQQVTFTGVVRLADRQPGEFGGTTVTAGSSGEVQALTAGDGSFTLVGGEISGGYVRITASHSGYGEWSQTRYLSAGTGARTIDLGTIVLSP